jgi:hypothetical protein
MRELSATLMLQSHKSFVPKAILWHVWERGDIPEAVIIAVSLVVFIYCDGCRANAF